MEADSATNSARGAEKLSLIRGNTGMIPGYESIALFRRACSFMASMASAECAMAPPARISAATQMASMISFTVAPFARALLVWARMQ